MTKNEFRSLVCRLQWDGCDMEGFNDWCAVHGVAWEDFVRIDDTLAACPVAVTSALMKVGAA